MQLANSYRGSAALRCAWFDTLAETHIAERWFSEAAVCQAHSVAIIGKELAAKGKCYEGGKHRDSLSQKLVTYMPLLIRQ